MSKIASMIKGGVKCLTDKNYRTIWMCRLGLYNHLSDEEYLKKLFQAKMGQPLNLGNPQTFNEKMQWLKLYDRKPEYTIMVDKYAVKQYIADRIGEEYVIPLLGVWDRFEDIDFDKLPKQFVLKCTHDCGGLVICRDKDRLDRNAARKKINRSLKRNYYSWGREWPYKDVKPRIIAEEYMQDGNRKDLPVYKFLCFDGEPRVIQVIQNDKQVDESIDYFDSQWNRLELRQNFPNSEKPLSKPQNLEVMLRLARRLASDKTGFIRVDLYEINGRLYFSEYTFFSDSGMANFTPDKWDAILGEWTTLPENRGGGI